MSNANAALAAQMQSRMDELSTQTARIIADQVQRARTQPRADARDAPAVSRRAQLAAPAVREVSGDHEQVV